MYKNAIPNVPQWTPPTFPKTAGSAVNPKKGLGSVVRVAVPKVLVMPRRRGMGAALLQPSTATTQASMINWAAGPVTVPTPESYVGQMVQSLENDVRYKLESGGTILDPDACAAKMSGELASWCSIYPGACTGNEAGMIANLCGHYDNYLSDQQASLGNPATNYVAPQLTYPVYSEGNPITYYTPPATSQPATIPITAAQVGTPGAPSVPATQPAGLPSVTLKPASSTTQAGGGSGGGQVQTMIGAGSNAPAAAAAASNAMSDFMSKTFNVFGVDVPAWGAVAAVGLGLFMFSGRGK